MKSLPIAGLVSLAALGAQAQAPLSPFIKQGFESVVVTATRSLQATPSLRDTVVITRDDLESSGALSLGEVLQRRAGVELRATGGPGQPQGIFIRGAGTAQTLVLVDGLRVGSATQGTTSIESIPLEMIERIEIVKGPMSSLYGSEAAGGVIQIFTRGKSVPHFFASSGYGTDNDRRVSTGLSTSDDKTLVSMAMGLRKVDAPSATNARNTFAYVPDRDPHETRRFQARASARRASSRRGGRAASRSGRAATTSSSMGSSRRVSRRGRTRRRGSTSSRPTAARRSSGWRPCGRRCSPTAASPTEPARK
jgi:vitamin B12 transporter